MEKDLSIEEKDAADGRIAELEQVVNPPDDRASRFTWEGDDIEIESSSASGNPRQ